MQKVVKFIYLFLGSISFIIAVVAYLTPLIPTLPFLLVSLFCFTRGSQKFHDWLMYKTFVGSFINNLLVRRAISRKMKYISVFFLCISSAISIWWVEELVLRIIVAASFLGIIIFILLIKNVEDLDKDNTQS